MDQTIIDIEGYIITRGCNESFCTSCWAQFKMRFEQLSHQRRLTSNSRRSRLSFCAANNRMRCWLVNVGLTASSQLVWDRHKHDILRSETLLVLILCRLFLWLQTIEKALFKKCNEIKFSNFQIFPTSKKNVWKMIKNKHFLNFHSLHIYCQLVLRGPPPYSNMGTKCCGSSLDSYCGVDYLMYSYWWVILCRVD